MNLVIDIGNTRIKAAVFEGENFFEKKLFVSETELLNSINLFQDIQNCLIASVTNNPDEIFSKLSEKFPTILFKSDTPIPLKILYKSSATLGSDRIAASVGGYCTFKNENVLSIDAGTCIKYNFTNHQNEYLGGAISPGIRMRLKAMNQYTDRLPLVEPELNYQKLVSENTQESLLSGAIIGAACEVDEMINRYKEKFNDLKIILTGGDLNYLSPLIKNSFFARPNLVLEGLNEILRLNAR